MQSLGPDWWTFWATIFSGIITALATMTAIIYTNRKSNAQLKEQEENMHWNGNSNFNKANMLF